jgi:hypothetical protein
MGNALILVRQKSSKAMPVAIMACATISGLLLIHGGCPNAAAFAKAGVLCHG